MKRPPEIYTQDEVERLIAACSTSASTGVRNRALIGLLYRTGLRQNEATELRPRDVEFGSGRVTVRAGKGNKHSDGPVPRVVGIDQAGLALLAHWLNMRRQLGLNGHQPIFCTLHGGKLAGQYVRNLLSRLGKKANIEKRVHAHGFRHTFACELSREGIELGVISKQLGHRSQATTAKYLDHIAPQRVFDTIGKREWDGQRATEGRASRAGFRAVA